MADYLAAMIFGDAYKNRYTTMYLGHSTDVKFVSMHEILKYSVRGDLAVKSQVN